jgi:small nuclear ribonucleoprotein G
MTFLSSFTPTNLLFSLHFPLSLSLSDYRYIGKQVLVKLNGDRQVEGTLIGFDKFLNISLEKSYEITTPKSAAFYGPNGANVPPKIFLGVMTVRGASIVSIESLPSI